MLDNNVGGSNRPNIQEIYGLDPDGIIIYRRKETPTRAINCRCVCVGASVERRTTFPH